MLLFVRPILLLAVLASLAGCAETPPSDGTFATLQVKMDLSEGTDQLMIIPNVPFGKLHQKVIDDSREPNPDRTIQIPADQDVSFDSYDGMTKTGEHCEFLFHMYPLPGHSYLVDIGDIRPVLVPKNLSQTIAIIRKSQNSLTMSHCYIKRFEIMPDGSLKPFPSNDLIFAATQ